MSRGRKVYSAQLPRVLVLEHVNKCAVGLAPPSVSIEAGWRKSAMSLCAVCAKVNCGGVSCHNFKTVIAVMGTVVTDQVQFFSLIQDQMWAKPHADK